MTYSPKQPDTRTQTLLLLVISSFPKGFLFVNQFQFVKMATVINQSGLDNSC